MKLSILLIVGLLVSGSAVAENIRHAPISKALEIYDKISRDDQMVMEGSFSLLGDGMDWTNVFVEQRDKKRVYCVPKHVVLSSNQYFSIFREAVERYGMTSQPWSSRGFWLLRGLTDTS